MPRSAAQHQSRQQRTTGKAGYRLHDRRIAHSGGSGSVRTIKYELVHNDPEIFDRVAEGVHRDYLRLYGTTTLDDYLAHDGEQPPNIVDFWLEALALGGVFSYSAGDTLTDMVNTARGQRGFHQELFAGIEDELREQFDREAWLAFFAKEKRGAADKPTEQIERQFLNTLLKPDEAEESVRALARRYAEKLPDIPYGEAQIIFACDLFGVDYQEIKRRVGVSEETPTEKLTFIILPELETIETTDYSRTQVFEQVESRLGKRFHQRAKLKEAIGIGSNGNAFGNFLGGLFTDLREGHIDKVLADMQLIAGYNQDEVRDVQGRLERLHEMAATIGEPDIVPHWGEYRSDFNGKLESFASNRSRHKDTLNQQLAELTTELSDVIGLISELSQAGEKAGELLDGLEQVYQFAERATRIVLGNDDHALLPILISDVRRNLNEWVQEHQEVLRAHYKRRSDKPITMQDVAPKLSKDLQRVSLFFGDSKLIKFAKTKRAKQAFRQQTDIFAEALEQLLEAAEGNRAIEPKYMEAFRRFAEAASSKWGLSMVETLERATGVDTLRLQERERFHLSGFERGKYRQIEYGAPVVDDIRRACDWLAQWQQATQDPTQHEQLLDAIELYKTLAALLAQASEEQEFHFGEHDFNELQLVFLRNVHERLNAPSLNRFLQTLVAAELRGLVAILSRTQFVSRASVQGTNGMQAKLAVQGGDFEDGSFKADDSERFMMAFPNIEIEDEAWSRVDWLVDKSDNKQRVNVKQPRQATRPVLDIRTSKYQLQFLRWFLRRPKTKHCDLTMQGSFTINERTYQIDWSGDEPVCELADNRMFASVPFTLIPPEEKVPSDRPGVERYLGVDIGEYGLAWCVVEIEDDRADIVATGVVQHPQQEQLKEAVGGLKNQQRKGTFGMPSTYIERLRESLVGTFRNQIHSLALQYGATIVFEYSVSAFETGGNRIKKVYDSVKRSDAWSNQTDETKMLHKQAWGDRTAKGFKTGQEVSAAGTSQTCTKCKRWFAQELPEGAFKSGAQYKLYPVSGFDHLYEVPELNVKVFMRNSHDNELSGDKLYGAVQEFMRPPEDSEAREFATVSGMPSKLERGNSAVFVCSFSDCHFVTDADIQAAFTIALRGHISTHNASKKKNDERTPYYELAHEYQFEPVET